MEYLFKKISDLRELCQESGFEVQSKEGRIFHGILDILDEMANVLETGEYDSLLDEDAEYIYSFICPSCGEEIEVDDDIFGKVEEFACPKCSNMILVSPDVEDLKF